MADQPKRMTRSVTARCFTAPKECSIRLDRKDVESYSRIVRNASGEWLETIFFASLNTAHHGTKQKSAFTETDDFQRPKCMKKKKIHKRFGFHVCVLGPMNDWPKSPKQKDWDCADTLPWLPTYRYLLGSVWIRSIHCFVFLNIDRNLLTVIEFKALI